ncbi:hypothetical protein ACLOJK_024169 [Asimina triloba]
MVERQFITFEDLIAIRDSYGIPSSIVLLPSNPYETTRDYRFGHICLNESMLRAEIWIPFEFVVAEALLAFHVSSAHVIPHSWKVIPAALGLCGVLQEGRRENYRQSSQSYAGVEVNVLFRPNIFREGHLGHPRTVGGASARSYFRIRCRTGRLSAVGPDALLGDPLLVAAAPVPSLSKAERKEGHSQKRARPSERGNSSADPGSFVEGIFELSPTGGTSPMTDHRDERSAVLLHEQRLSEVARLRSLAVAKYLRSDIYHHREEFECTHYSQGGYVRALSDVAALHPGIDLSPLYRRLHMCGRPQGKSVMERRSSGDDSARASPAVDLKE